MIHSQMNSAMSCVRKILSYTYLLIWSTNKVFGAILVEIICLYLFLCFLLYGHFYIEKLE